MNKIRKGDEVVVKSGKSKGQRGTVLEVYPDGRVLVEGVNVFKKHVKPNPNVGEPGGIQDKAMPIDVVVVMNGVSDPIQGWLYGIAHDVDALSCLAAAACGSLP